MRSLATFASLVVLLAACSGSTPSPSGVSASAPAHASSEPGSAAPRSPGSGRPLGPPVATPIANPPSQPSGDGTTATIKTGKGDIVIALYTDSSPVAAQNFINLSEAGFYDGTTFHRIVPDFVIQGGDPAGNGTGGPGYTIKDEPVVGDYTRGVVAMARTQQPDSQGSQFFIVLTDLSGQLPKSGRYAIFGNVTSGMDVVDQIAAMPNSGPPDNRALVPVKIDTVSIQQP